MPTGTENNKQDLMSLPSVYLSVPVVDLCVLPRGKHVPRLPRLPTRSVYPVYRIRGCLQSELVVYQPINGLPPTDKVYFQNASVYLKIFLFTPCMFYH